MQYIDAMKSSHSNEYDIIPMREKYQYTPAIEIDEQRVEDLLKMCQNMIKETKGMIGQTLP